MQEIELIQQRLTRIPCPICSETKYAVVPRGATGPAESLFTARCVKCGYNFSAGVPTADFSRFDPDTVIQLKEIVCPLCMEHGVDLNFRCTPTVRLTYYFVTCRACGHRFHEKAPMEAFE
jgi:uncharacterized Zn finger protein